MIPTKQIKKHLNLRLIIWNKNIVYSSKIKTREMNFVIHKFKLKWGNS